MKKILSVIFSFFLVTPAFAGMNYPPLVPGQVPGTTTNDNACTTCVGFMYSTSVPSGSAVSLNIAGNDTTVATISSVVGGDYDVRGKCIFTGTAITLEVCGVNSSPNAQPSEPTTGRVSTTQTSGAACCTLATGTERFTFASGGSNLYLIASCVAGSGTCTAFGVIEARKAR